MRLRDVTLDDVDAYVRMRCDPVMMADLGGPLPREGIEEKVQRDIQQAAEGTAWIKMVVSDQDTAVVAGTVALWSHDFGGQQISEIGWMVLRQFQGRGLGKLAVWTLLDMARVERRWGTIHAFPATTNAPSNGICRSLGFSFVGNQEVTFANRVIGTNHWTIDPFKDGLRPMGSRPPFSNGEPEQHT